MAQVALLDTGVLRSIHHQLHTVETGLSAAFRQTKRPAGDGWFLSPSHGRLDGEKLKENMGLNGI